MKRMKPPGPALTTLQKKKKKIDCLVLSVREHV